MAYSEEVKNNTKIAKEASKKIKELIKQKKYKEAKNICNEFKNDAVIQSQMVTILIREGKLEEAKEICEKFKDNAPIQSQLATMLINEDNKESLEKAQKICINEKFKQNKRIQEQLRFIESKLKDYEMFNDLHEDIDSRISNPYLDEIKTRLYYNDISVDFVEKIKQNTTDLTEYEKTIILLAIYDKQKNAKMVEQIIKNARKTLKENPENLKQENKLR